MKVNQVTSTGNHWDTIFSNTDDSYLGWYEKNASKTLELLDQIPEWKESTIFLPGAGTSVLIDELLHRGIRLVLNDISNEALRRVKDRLGDSGRDITWLCQDIARPIQNNKPHVDIWIDRAVLHFLTDEADIVGYFENVKSTLKVGGYAIFAEFSKTGVPKCAGLPVCRYSLGELSDRLGREFELILHFDHIYLNPSGNPRPYVYALYQREKQIDG
jgi:hypothetical protein